MNELHRMPVGTAWLPDQPPRFGDERPRVFKIDMDYVENGHLIRHFEGSVALQQGARGSTIAVDLQMSPNPNEHWVHQPLDEAVDLEVDLLCGHGVRRWSMRHGIGELSGEDGSRPVWHATHFSPQLLISDISHLELYMWFESFALVQPHEPAAH